MREIDARSVQVVPRGVHLLGRQEEPRLGVGEPQPGEVVALDHRLERVARRVEAGLHGARLAALRGDRRRLRRDHPEQGHGQEHAKDNADAHPLQFAAIGAIPGSRDRRPRNTYESG